MFLNSLNRLSIFRRPENGAPAEALRNFIFSKFSTRGDSTEVLGVVGLSDLSGGYKITKQDLFLDNHNLIKFYISRMERIGSISVKKSNEISQRLAWRLACRLARHISADIDISGSAVAQAWFFAIWVELCSLMPLHNLARKIKTHAAGRVIIIPVDNIRRIKCLSYWASNEMEPFYLARALLDQGANVVLLAKDLSSSAYDSKIGEFVVNFELDGAYYNCNDYPADQVSPTLGTAVIPAGIRGYGRVLSLNPGSIVINSPFSYYPGPFHADLALPRETRCFLELATASSYHDAKNGFSFFEISLPSCDLIELASKTLIEFANSSYNAARLIVERYSIDDLQICDHMFFQSAVLADAVRARGGLVNIWPHSSNAVHSFAHIDKDVNSLVCMTDGAATSWKKKISPEKVLIDSRVGLRPFHSTHSILENEMPTIVFFGGANRLGLLPILDYDSHTNTHRNICSLISKCVKFRKIIFKSKNNYEDDIWFAAATGGIVPFEISDLSPFDIAEHNMIFLSISYGSTALLEGISRGVPCMIVREQDLADYIDFDPRIIPIGDSQTIAQELARCENASYLKRLAESQSSWYSDFTNF